jgi:hypothetical protein
MSVNGRKNADDALLRALACGATVEVAARQASMSSRTAHRRLKDPHFVQKLNQIKADMLKRTSAMLGAGSLEAGKTLLALQAPNNPPSTRLGAAKATLEAAVKYREATEFEERLAALEQQLAEQQPPSQAT